MPPKTQKTTKTSQRRTKTKKLGAKELSAAETKKVKGGAIATNALQPLARMGDGSVRPITSIQDGTSNTLLKSK